MRKLTLILALFIHISYSQHLQSVKLDGNNISSYFWNSGIFNQQLSGNIAAFEWPKETGKLAAYSSGLSIAGYINGNLRMSAASYSGEYIEGYCINGQYFKDSRFKFYKIKKGDNYINNPDWRNWGSMVPFGAPYNDVNHNGSYDYLIDTPGVKSSSQTIFICLTDADSTRHKIGEGFGGGTKPLYNEVHFTAWCYNYPGYEDMQFLKWEILNKSNYIWDSVRFCILSDFDLGWPNDDYIGCDSNLGLSYCYNGDNDDDINQVFWAYGINPPAVGIAFLNCNNPDSKFFSSTYVTGTGTPGPICEKDAVEQILPAYCFMRGLKKDRTPWVIPNTNPPKVTKFCYSGDPETGTGWTEFKGSVQNCGGSLTGTTISLNPVGDRRSLMTFGNEYLKMNVNDTFIITGIQLIARGNNHLNSVTALKQLTVRAHDLCRNGFIIGINPVSNEIPSEFRLYQNYPNPFNPTTKFTFAIPKTQNVIINVYDAMGREVEVLIDGKLNAGTYSVEWNASSYSSGVFFYRIITDSYSETKKMVLIK